MGTQSGPFGRPQTAARKSQPYRKNGAKSHLSTAKSEQSQPTWSFRGGRTGASPAESLRNSPSSAAPAALVTTRPPIGTEHTFAVRNETKIRGSKSATFQVTGQNLSTIQCRISDHSLTRSTTGRWIPKRRWATGSLRFSRLRKRKRRRRRNRVRIISEFSTLQKPSE